LVLLPRSISEGTVVLANAFIIEGTFRFRARRASRSGLMPNRGY
jgi:hypothetical protein